MTLTILDNLEQGTDAWHDARRGIITASAIGQLITAKTIRPASNDYSRALANSLVAERITGYTEPIYVSSDMERGHLDEPVARDIYSKHFAPVVECGFMIREVNGHRIGYSPDGLVGDDGLVEFKSRRQKKHLATILDDRVPLENVAQCQTGLYVSGREWVDYASYCGGMPLWVHRVYPDQRWFEAITETLDLFEETAARMIARYQLLTRGLPKTERVDHYAEPEIFA